MRIAVLLACTLPLIAQTPSQITFGTGAAPPPTSASTRVVGTPGQQTLYYWVIARYPSGYSSPVGPASAFQTVGAANLSASNYVVVSWSAMPQATGYDVLRSTTPTFPAPAGCTACAVVLNTSGATVNDTGAALSDWPAAGTSPAVPAQAVLNLDNISAAQPFVNVSLLSQKFSQVYKMVLVAGTPTAGNCAQWGSYGLLTDAGASCGTGSGGGSPGGGTDDIQYYANSTTFGGGRCTMNSSSQIVCTGGFSASSGASPGEIQLSELLANGSNFVSWLAPASLAASTHYTMPATPPSGTQYLACGTPSSGVSTCNFSTAGVVTKVQREYYFFPATQTSGGSGQQGNLLSPSSGGATIDAVGTNPYRLGRLGGFVDGSTTSVNGALLIPAAWDGGTVTADIGYSQGSGGSAGQAVRWRISTACVGAGEDESGPTRNTADAVNSTIVSATANTHTLASISSVTMTGCAASELFTFILDREGGNAGDTLTATAYLDSLRITFLVNLQ